MCGIVGVWARSAEPVERRVAAAAAMCATLERRGPDGQGLWHDPDAGVVLGHRRLSIIDLTDAGRQPMMSASGRLVIAFNGEIYNYLDLRQELEASGLAPAWRGHSDTEVLLAAIEAWGLESSLRRIEGMFGLALWERGTGRLSLARDRMGEKPLYYGWNGRNFLVASELKAFVAHPEWQGEVDPLALQLLVRYGYVPAPHSIYRGIHKLPPGCFLHVTTTVAPGIPLEPHAYWSISDDARNHRDEKLVDPEQAVAELDRLMADAVRRQMVADVPLGAFLSGGIDSSAVVAHMQRAASRPVRTYTIGFREGGYDEAVQAAVVARHLGTDHTELYVTPDAARSVIPLLPDLYDEPFADASQIPTHLVARLAREDVTVALSGDGGDELFGGYNRYLWGRQLSRWIEAIPLGARRMAAFGATSLSPAGWDALYACASPLLPARMKLTMPGHKVHKLAGIIDSPSPDDAYRRLISQWPHPEEFVLVDAVGETWADLQHRRRLPDDFIERMMLHDQLAYLPDDILVKVDRAAMGVSLETRVPLLDRKIVEFAWRLPPSMRLRDGKGKWILRQVLERYVPRQMFERPKQGFAVPLDVWLRGPLRAWAEELLDPARLRREGYFAADRVSARWQEHLSGRHNWQYGLWPILMFQAWRERWQ